MTKQPLSGTFQGAETGRDRVNPETEEGGFRVTERFFSDDESRLSLGIANIHAVVPDIEANKDKIAHAVELFKEKRVNVAIFPEFSLSGYFWEDRDACRRYMDQAVIENHLDWVEGTLKPLLDDHLRAVVLNNLRKGPGGKYFNSTFVVNREYDVMEEKIRYDKVFLPRLEQDYTVSGGDDVLILDSPHGRFGFTTCYDICFSQLVLEYAKLDKVDAIIELASWRAQALRDYPGMNVGTDLYYGSLWDMLLPAMAAMNQVWIIACNAVGRHGVTGAGFWGGSGLWSPSGLNLLKASHVNDELLVVHNVDIRGQRAREKDDFNYALDFNAIYRPVHGKRTFTRIEGEEEQGA